MSSLNLKRILIGILIILLCCYGGESRIKKNTRRYQNATSKELQWANIQAFLHFNWTSTIEKYLVKSNITVEMESLSFVQLLDSLPTIDGILGAPDAEYVDYVSKSIMRKYNCSRDKKSIKNCIKRLETEKINQISQGKLCLSEDTNYNICMGVDLSYRTIDGKCNNRDHLIWGKSNTPYKRLLFPAYTDNISSIYFVPNARELSTSLVKNEEQLDNSKTVAMTIWGIFIGHDLTYTGMSKMIFQNNSIECCTKSGNNYPSAYNHPLCAVITIPDTDPFFGPLKRTCMNYVRSIPSMRMDCTFGPREQLNQVTHYLDASMIYGSTKDQTLALRGKSKGSLLNNIHDGFMYMPEVDGMCMWNSSCYFTGDFRVNSHPQVTTMYTLWLREHNRIARELAKLNPKWDDERTFQETRKIIVAFIQHITYTEWLPLLISKDNIKSQNLISLSNGYSKIYDRHVDPRISNSFATAILPSLTHSMLADSISLYDKYGIIQKRLVATERYYRPDDLLRTDFNKLIRGMSTQSTEKIDMIFPESMTNKMYRNLHNDFFGMDIFSLDIQRTRDHGIPRYGQFRKFCNLTNIKSIGDLSDIMVEGAVSKLLENYKEVEDIDLIVGALFEKHESNSMVGPTMRCIIAEQFKRTKQGDRYFYDFPEIFDENQINEISKMSLSRLFCNNYDKNKDDTNMQLQKNVFLNPTMSGGLSRCDNTTIIQKVNLEYWREIIVKRANTASTTESFHDFLDKFFSNGRLITDD